MAESVVAKEILIADRLTNSVYRYSESGTKLGILLTDNVNLNQPSGMQVSPDLTKLYVASTQNNQVVRYDYNFAAGTATNPTVFADAADGLAFPSSIIFNPAGNKVYISNLGGTGVAQFNTDGTSAGAPISGGSSFQLTGMAFAPGGELLVGGFMNLAGTDGSVAKSDAGITALADFVAPNPAILGTAGLLRVGNDLYVSGLFAGTLRKFNATTGAADGAFAVNGLSFPQGIIAAPDGNGMLVGILGVVAGGGSIARYGFDGTPLGVFAPAQGDPMNGFTEPTSMVVVPEPASVVLVGVALAVLVAGARCRVCRT
jgi:DNA-binding beta-propeller fold protein YncE